MFDIVEGSFIWNAEKERLNRERHGVDFRTAIRAFGDPARLIMKDEEHSAKEARFFCIGRLDQGILTVRFTYRAEMIRIIGAGYWRKGKSHYETQTRS
jgi:uncharacterized DUF497 family protein